MNLNKTAIIAIIATTIRLETSTILLTYLLNVKVCMNVCIQRVRTSVNTDLD